jgi:two-component sensor histidine kinase/ABC-type uncharacterized transport system substrate-binding protein
VIHFFRKESILRRHFALIDLLLVITSAAIAEEQVLLIHSYHPEFSWTQRLDQGVHDALDAAEEHFVVHTEYLDSKRHSPEVVAESFLRLLAAKYGAAPPEAIVVSDNNAFDLLVENRDEIFPGIPIFFAGINNYVPSFGTPEEGITGIAEAVDYAANLELIAGLHPTADHIVTVSGPAVTAVINLEAFRRVAAAFEDRFVFEHWHAIPMTEVTRRLKALDSRTVVFNLGFFRDSAGHVFGVEESSTLLAEASPVPVYTAWDFMVVGGVLGGVVVDGYLHGQGVAEQLIRHTTGTPLRDIPVITEPTIRGYFDHSALKRFAISRDRLPRDTVIYGLPATMYHQYRGRFWFAVGVIGMLSFLVFGLLMSRRRRIEAERSLRASLDEKNVLLREIHHRVKNNLQVVSSLLSLQLGHFEAGSAPYAALEASRNRILTMAQVHELLYGDVDLPTIGARDYLEGIVRQVISTAQGQSLHVDLVLRIENAPLSLDVAVPIGLIVNELVSNSVRHAFGPSSRGTITIDLATTSDALVLLVQDDGPGFCFEEARQSSMGLQLVGALTDQLNGTLSYKNGQGSTFEIHFHPSPPVRV